MSTPDQPPTVLCLDCGTPVHTPVSRARRVGEGCWRKRRALARKLATPVVLPGLSGRGGRPVQDGPTLLDHAGVDDVAQAEDPQP